MAEIRGLKIAIGADSSAFYKEMKKLRQDSSLTEKSVKKLAESLQIDYDADTATAAQKKLQEAIMLSAQKAELLSTRLGYLKQYSNVDSTEYKKLSAELDATNAATKKLERSQKELHKTMLCNLDSFQKLHTALGKVSESFGAGVRLIKEQLVEENGIFRNLLGDIDEEQQQYLKNTLTQIENVCKILPLLEQGGEILKNLQTGVKSVLSAFQGFSPVGKVLSVIAGLLLYLYATNENFRQSVHSILSALSTVAIPVLQLLTVPLQLIAQLVQTLSPLLVTFGGIIAGVFSFVGKVISTVVNSIIAGINLFITGINGIIQMINALSFLWGGKKIAQLSKLEQTSMIQNNFLDNVSNMPSYVTGGNNTTNNYNQTSNQQTIQVTVQNYGEKVDVDDLCRQINKKLVELM